ncbi:hypothetical protein, partial [Klebsiella pneumoniae]|uniref:hypothetical protein n=1 Tax=Klebsiella pneumoniae TaxID=573 RepID=UPI003B5C35F0
MGDLQVVARLTALMVAALKAPMPVEEQLASFAAVFALAKDADVTPPREAGHIEPGGSGDDASNARPGSGSGSGSGTG